MVFRPEWQDSESPALQLQLTVEQRYKMMMDASRTILRMLIDNGHKKPLEIIKRT